MGKMEETLLWKSEKVSVGKNRMDMCELLNRVYELLLEKFGPQGWWPVKSLAGERGFDDKGYHPGRFDIPSTDEERFEIIVGAILTQNTTWKNVENVLNLLLKDNLMSPRAIVDMGLEELALKIRSSGYYNQKAKKLRAISQFFLSRSSGLVCPERKELLEVWGVGKETADSILLYAFNYPIFVVDAYTRRFVLGLNKLWRYDGGESFVDENKLKNSRWYDTLQNLFHSCLSKDSIIFNEFHALIVRVKGRVEEIEDNLLRVW